MVAVIVMSSVVESGAASDRADRTSETLRMDRADPSAEVTIDFVRKHFVATHPVLAPGAPAATLSEQRPVLDRGPVRKLTQRGDVLEPELAASDERRLAKVLLPATADGPFVVTDTRSGRWMKVRLLDTKPVPAAVGAGIVVYNGAVRGGAWMHQVTDAGTEDFVLFSSPADTSGSLRYELRPGPGLSGLRLVANTLELLDGSGDPKLRASPPWLIDARGTVRSAQLKVRECSVDTNPAAPQGRPVTAPGADRCTVEVSWSDRGLAYPILVDPSWTSTGTMAVRRTFHTAKGAGTLGILVAGGANLTTGTILNSTEAYSLSTGTWSTKGNLSTARYAHAAVAQHELSGGGFVYASGGVIVMGGIGSGGSYLATCEIFNATAGTWSSAPTMGTARVLPAVARYDTGKFLVVGGANAGGPLSSAESLTWGGGSWSSLASMASGRLYHTATPLFTTTPTYNQNQSEVLVAGGIDSSSALVSVAQRYQPSSNTWINSGTMYTAVQQHTATQALAGTYQYDVFVGGGYNSGAQRVLQRYDRANATWSFHAAVGDWRYAHTATLLADNQTILFASGMGPSAVLDNAYAYNTNTSSGSGSSLPANTGRQWHVAALVNTSPSKVMIAGGHNTTGSTTFDTALLYTH